MLSFQKRVRHIFQRKVCHISRYRYLFKNVRYFFKNGTSPLKKGMPSLENVYYLKKGMSSFQKSYAIFKKGMSSFPKKYAIFKRNISSFHKKVYIFKKVCRKGNTILRKWVPDLKKVCYTIKKGMSSLKKK